jgi:Ca2+-binding RTX toxin-like protein
MMSRMSRWTMALFTMSLVFQIASSADVGADSSRQRPQCTITGTAGDDEVITGTRGPDVICGRGGDDQIFARQGADIVYGGPGTDVLVGRSGKDRLYGNRGFDFISGKGRRDLLSGGRGKDCLAAEDSVGGDIVEGGPRKDYYSDDPGDVIRSAEVPSLRHCPVILD